MLWLGDAGPTRAQEGHWMSRPGGFRGAWLQCSEGVCVSFHVFVSIQSLPSPGISLEPMSFLVVSHSSVSITQSPSPRTKLNVEQFQFFSFQSYTLFNPRLGKWSPLFQAQRRPLHLSEQIPIWSPQHDRTRLSDTNRAETITKHKKATDNRENNAVKTLIASGLV